MPDTGWDAVSIIADLNKENYDLSRLPSYIRYYPAGTSRKNITHWMQSLKHDGFRDFNYGKEENWKRYGTEKPPQFDFESKPMPRVVVYFGGQDSLATPEDVHWVLERLPEGTAHFIEEYDHLAFTWSPGAAEKIYKTLIEEVKSASM
eukprot:935_1